jgi:hypothetical protein
LALAVLAAIAVVWSGANGDDLELRFLVVALAVAPVQAWAACAVKSDGSAWCWGPNQLGGLGDGTTTTSSRPVAVKLP